MGETIRQTYEGILKLLETVIIPDWGALIGLIPVGLLLLALAFLGRLAARWLGFYVAQPDLPPSFRAARPLRTVILQRLALVPAGAVLIALALTVLPRRVGPLPQVGWDMAVLILGILTALAGAGLAVAATDAADAAEEHGPAAVRSPRQAIRSVLGVIDRVPAPYRPLAGIALGLVIILLAFVLAGGRPGPGLLPEVNIPLVLLGVLLGLASAAAAIRGWDRADAAPEAPASRALVVESDARVEHGSAGRPRRPGAFA